MFNNQQSQTPSADKFTSQITIDETTTEEPLEYDWDPLSATLSWESESDFMGGTGLTEQPFRHFSVCINLV